MEEEGDEEDQREREEGDLKEERPGDRSNDRHRRVSTKLPDSSLSSSTSSTSSRDPSIRDRHRHRGRDRGTVITPPVTRPHPVEGPQVLLRRQR